MSIITKLRSTLSICIVVICVIVFMADARDQSSENCSVSSAFYDYDLSSLAGQNFSITYDSGNGMEPIYFTICNAYIYLNCPEGSPVCISTSNGLQSGGSLETQSLQVADEGDGIKAQYSSGSVCSYIALWETVINIQCDSGALGEGTTQVITASASGCLMNISILSPAGCPIRKKWVLPVFIICIFMAIIMVFYLLVIFFRRLSRPRTPTGITPSSPEEILPLLSPRPSSPSLFINDFIFAKQDDGSPRCSSGGSTKKFLLDSPTPEGEPAKLPDDKTEETTNADDPEKGMCKICWAQPVDCALVDCGHMLCVTCAANVMTCPFCRRKVITRVKLYYS